MFLDILYVIMIMASGQALLLSFHFITKKNDRLPNRLLGFLMFLFALNLLDVTQIISGYYVHHPHLLGLTSLFPYLYGPVLYLFSRAVSEKKKRLEWSDYLHFLPFIILMIVGLPLFYFQSAEWKVGLVTKTVEAPVLAFFGMLIPVAGILYVVLSFRVLRRYQNKIKENYSNVEQINMEWLRYFIIGNGVIWVFVIVSYIAHEIVPEFAANLLIYIPLSCFIFWDAYISLTRRSDFFIKSAEDIKSPASPQYSKSGLTEEQADQIIKNLKLIIESEKPYLNSGLKLQDLSEMLAVPAHHLTEILNTRLKQNFYDFINNYRVNEVKRLIEEDSDRKYNLLSLALDAGFSSKSTFNSIFKKHTGLTPSEFRKEINRAA